MTDKIILATRTQLEQDLISDMMENAALINKMNKQFNLPAVINLSLGEPHLPIPNFIAPVLIQFLQSEDAARSFNYSPSQGNAKILTAISKLYQYYYPQLNYSENEVMICNGANQGLFNALNILLDANDAVLVFAPYFCMYEMMVKQLGGNLISMQTQPTYFKPSAKKLHEQLTAHPNIKAIIFNYPNNPTGVTLSEEEARQLACVLQDFPNMAIIIDDVYRELASDKHFTVVDVAPELKERSIVINSASKGLIGAPGMRIGMIGANAAWIKKMALIQTSAVNSVPYLTELTLHAAITHKLENKNEYQHWIQETKRTYACSTNYFSRALTELGFKVVLAESGFFIFADASLLKNKMLTKIKLQNDNQKKSMLAFQNKINSNKLRHDHDIAMFLLHIANVVVVPGSAFGMAKENCYLRFSCARPLDELERAIEQIKMAFQ